MPADPTLRAGDAERDLVAERLRQAHVEGRLDAAEFGERLDAALSARTLGELVPLTRDLPAGDARPLAPALRTPAPRGPAAWALLTRVATLALVASLVLRFVFDLHLPWWPLLILLVVGRRMRRRREGVDGPRGSGTDGARWDGERR